MTEATPPPVAARRILMVRLSAIGDIVFAAPLIGAARRALPDAHLAWLAQPQCAPLLQHHPELDEVIAWPEPTLRALARRGAWRQCGRLARTAVAELCARRFELALDVQGLLKSALPTWLSGAPARIGLGSREGSAWLMTWVVPRGGERGRIGAEYRHLAATLGWPTTDFVPRIVPGAAATRAAAARLAAAELPAEFVACCPFTTRPQKHWVEDRWAELAGRIAAELGWPTVLLGGPEARPAARRIAARAPVSLRDFTGQTELLEAAALLAAARAVIGVDTGLTHLGLAFQRPTVALFGATRPYLDPGQANARVLYRPRACSPCRRRPTCGGTFDCMRELNVADVLRALREVLDA